MSERSRLRAVGQTAAARMEIVKNCRNAVVIASRTLYSSAVRRLNPHVRLIQAEGHSPGWSTLPGGRTGK